MNPGAAAASIQKWMHHFADNRTGANYRDFDHQVVERSRLHPRQRRHLRAAFDLKNADRIGLLQHRVNLWIVGGQMRQIERDLFMLAHQRQRLFQHRQHPEPE